MNKIDHDNSKFLSRNVINIFALIWLAIISLLTVVKYSPEYLNADILINSVMSLQNVTLYYWGQNRLISILPLVASLINNPLYNLIFILPLLVPSASLCGIVYSIRDH